jgi:hypothetical protein
MGLDCRHDGAFNKNAGAVGINGPDGSGLFLP